jgi:MoxR-like ATPase
VASTGQLAELQRSAEQVYVDPSLIQYAVEAGGRHPPSPTSIGLAELAKYLSYGASPRATHHLVEAARALACCAAAAMCCPKTWATWPPTCCATAWC